MLQHALAQGIDCYFNLTSPAGAALMYSEDPRRLRGQTGGPGQHVEVGRSAGREFPQGAKMASCP